MISCSPHRGTCLWRSTSRSDSVTSLTVDYTITVMEQEGHPGPVVASDSACILPVVRGYALHAGDEQGVAAYTLTATRTVRSAS